MIALAAQPSPLWFATRGAGIVTLILLTVSVSLGILTAGGARNALWPRFLSAGLHRNLSLLALAFLAIHIATAVLDPFARLGWRDALIPFVSSYRPFWLGLGVVGGELITALALTSLVRPLLGHARWRTIHWLAYASWPVALLHSLGTGSDAAAPWSLGLTTACLAGVVACVSWRLAAGSHAGLVMRTTFGLFMLAGIAGVSAWAAQGPLRPGWAHRAGTPTAMLKGGASGSARPSPAATQPANRVAGSQTQDLLVGSYARLPGGQVRLMLTDVRDPTIQLVVRSAGPGEYQPVLAIVHNGVVGCVAPAAIGEAIGATCGKTRVLIVIAKSGKGTDVTGRLVIEGA